MILWEVFYGRIEPDCRGQIEKERGYEYSEYCCTDNQGDNWNNWPKPIIRPPQYFKVCKVTCHGEIKEL